jgi:hypothetical protein
MFKLLEKIKSRKNIDEIALYTASIGSRDKLLNIDYGKLGRSVTCFCTEDQEPRQGVKYVRVPMICECPVRTARFFKVLPHLFFPEAKCSVWFDNNFKFKNFSIDSLLAQYLSECDLATYSHPERDCAYEEIDACIKLKREDPAVLERQRVFYRQDGLPDHAGLISSGLLIRRHTPEVIDLMSLWWEHLRSFSRRDQVSFTYARWKLNFNYKIIPGSIWNNDYFEWVPHSGAEPRHWIKAHPSSRS